jgi:hypothetical protein
MWALLKKTDIEQAKQEIKLRRSETLRRHAEESQNLDTDRVELETLNLLVDIFVQKHRKPAIVSHAPVASPVSPPTSTPTVSAKATPTPTASTQHSGGKTPADTKHRRHLGQTVYASYMRATSRV